MGGTRGEKARSGATQGRNARGLWLLSALASCWAVWSAGPARAFTPDTHELLTRAALTVYARCRGAKAVSYVAEALHAGNAEQDAPTLSRALNWHFYGRGTGLRDGWVVHRSAERMLAHRLEQLRWQLEDRRGLDLADLSKAVGALAHYLQDMAVPAHAVPIFHIAADGFDHYLDAPDAAARAHARLVAEGSCGRILEAAARVQGRSLSASIDALYDASARHTRAALLHRVPSKPYMHWSDVWIADGKTVADRTCRAGVWSPRTGRRTRRGFGCYHPCFQIGESCQGGPTVQDYDALFMQQAGAAMDHTVVLLMLVGAAIDGV